MRVVIKNIYLVIFFCFLSFVFGCKKREAGESSSLKSKLGTDVDATVSIDENDLSDLEDVRPKTMDDLEVISIEVDTSDYLAPTPKQVQMALKNAGYYKGEIDGVIGSKSKAAIKDFQNDNGLTDDGKVGPKTWSKLKEYR